MNKSPRFTDHLGTDWSGRDWEEPRTSSVSSWWSLTSWSSGSQLQLHYNSTSHRSTVWYICTTCHSAQLNILSTEETYCPLTHGTSLTTSWNHQQPYLCVRHSTFCQPTIASQNFLVVISNLVWLSDKPLTSSDGKLSCCEFVDGFPCSLREVSIING